jgi:hypothetical protein
MLSAELRKPSNVRLFIGSCVIFLVVAILTELQRGSLQGLVSAELAEQTGLSRWHNEDGPLEMATVICAVGAAVLLIWVHYRCRKLGILAKRSHYVLLTLMTAFMIFFAGEEISWGQRILGFGTPEIMRDTNQQGEFNIHNLGIIHAYKDGLLTIAIFVWGVLLPLAKPFFGFVAKLQRALYMPLPPLQLSSYFAAAIGFRVIFKPLYGNIGQEGLEFLFAFAMLVLGCYAAWRPRALFQ